MAEELRFTADAALIDRLGRELVGKQETALIELVKNCYDADATEVKVTFGLGGVIIIDDNGTGMTRDELIEGFLRLASDMKVRQPLSDRFRRRRAGRKGIGRFATQRLGSHLTLQTWKAAGEPGLQLTVNWRNFQRGRALEEIPVLLEEIGPRHPGTELQIRALRDDWSESQIRRSWRGVMNLLQPFPVAPVAQRPNADPGFEVGFWRVGERFSDPELVSDFQTEILDHMHAVIEFRVDEDGVAEWRMTQNKYLADTRWEPVHHEHLEEKSPPPYAHLRNAWMKAHYAILDPTEFSGLIYTRIREVLFQEGGIRLYRNDFRVVPYGDSDNDWLRLDEAYSRRSLLIPIANRNFFGVIDVYDPEGRNFEEHTSREGLIETSAFSELRGLATTVLITAARKIAEERGRKVRAGGSGTQPTERYLSRLREASRKAREAVGTGPEQQVPGGTATSAVETVVKLLGEAESVIEGAKAELADEAALLRLLATLGLTAAEFSHETGMTFQAVRLDFKTVFDVALEAKGNDNAFADLTTRARVMLDRLDALTSYLNELASARSARELAPVSVSRTIEEFERGMTQLAAKSEIRVSIETPAFDALYTQPLHRAEVASLLLNFYSNSAKAMRRTSLARRIHIEAERDDDGFVALRFSDTGDGIPPENRGRIFDLFFTTRAAAPTTASTVEEMTGTGLGLWIVHQIVSKAGGTVEVIDPPEGYTTCFEVRLPGGEDDLD
ncbi:MAG TPA: sensor histidine kinase [Allosphingosinicella sp.]|nr:sensor histidine kinase [Allosphingosinicella sp.]